jgi:hypothetical protein
LFYFTVICIPIKSHQSNQTRSTTLRIFIGCHCFLLLLLTFYGLQYMYMYNSCCLRTIYANYLDSTTKSNNFYNSNQTYKYSITGKGWVYALIEPALKHFFLNSYANYTRLCIFSKQEYEYILLKQINKKRYPNACVSAPDSNTFYVYLLFMLLKKKSAKYSISKTILKNFYHSNQT